MFKSLYFILNRGVTALSVSSIKIITAAVEQKEWRQGAQLGSWCSNADERQAVALQMKESCEDLNERVWVCKGVGI